MSGGLRMQPEAPSRLQAGGIHRRAANRRPDRCLPSSRLFSRPVYHSGAGGGRSLAGEVLFCDDQEVVLALVETGYAFAVMADLPNARLPGLCYIPLKDVQPLSFGVVRLPEDHNPILKYFLTLLERSMNPDSNEAP